ncbi:hypothetical protein QJS10_CPA16g00531 [Acorus calamus]|uniref:Aminotransferase-like plant mobile domain-containing protein n=1 Tax=Acorus calamus TaxID=4465 RepID=A0AAV9D2G7_ACOCL|nr:hypothetical protein QJS10_CPA16g00531 [Acorus calamus]
MDLHEWHGPVIDNLLYLQQHHRCHNGFQEKIWSWERLQVGRPNLQDSDFVLGDRPLGSRCNIVTQRFDESAHAFIYYRAQFDYQHESQVTWRPYVGKYDELPSICRYEPSLWIARVPLICFDIVEMHVPDRVARQFGFKQDIPCDVERIDRINRRGRQDVDLVPATQNISEVLARGALLYPNYEKWGRIVAVTRDLAEAVVGDMPQPEDDDPYVLSLDHGELDDAYDDTTGPAFFGIGEHVFTIEELFSEGVHITYDDPEQEAPQPPPHPATQAEVRPLMYYRREPRRLFGSSVVDTALGDVDEMTPITTATFSAPPDAPSSSGPPAPRKTKKKGWR